MKPALCVFLAGVLMLTGGCPSSSTTDGTFPYLTYAETFGVAAPAGSQAVGSGAAGVEGDAVFRLPLTVTFQNVHNNATLDTSFVAWIELGSIRTQEQQDALLRGGYVQLAETVTLGTAYTLPVGTFVYNGPGVAGATQISLGPAQGGAPDFVQGEATPGEGEGDEGETGDSGARVPTETSIELITPDVILVFSQPPVSCDSVGFTYSSLVTGEIVPGPATGVGGYKTLAQFDVYECSPFKPGLSFRSVGVAGLPEPNEFQEAEPITFTFYSGPVNQGAYCTVTIGSSVVFSSDEGDTSTTDPDAVAP